MKGRGQTGPKGIASSMIAELMVTKAGCIPTIATTLGCSSNNIRQRIANSSGLKALQIELRHCLLDMAEAVVWSKLEEGSFQAATYVLDRLGRERGYVRSEHVNLLTTPPETRKPAPIDEKTIALVRRKYIDGPFD